MVVATGRLIEVVVKAMVLILVWMPNKRSLTVSVFSFLQRAHAARGRGQ
jgi:hypothetical protein